MRGRAALDFDDSDGDVPHAENKYDTISPAALADAGEYSRVGTPSGGFAHARQRKRSSTR
jgi:hypothetical protein